MDLAMTSGRNTWRKPTNNAALPPALDHGALWRLGYHLTESNSAKSKQVFSPVLGVERSVAK
jgi:hypothetical protein